MSDAAPRVFAGAVSRAWANSGRPSYNAIAAATGSSLLPLSVSDVRGFLKGTALPSSSLQIEILFSALADVSGTPVNPVLRRDAIRSWLVASGADIDLYEPTGAGLEGISDILNHVVEVATYLGVAGAGGIIGNRADAAAVASAKRMFSAVRRRWSARTASQQAPLSQAEASEAAKAASIALGYSEKGFRIRTSEQRDDGSWLIIASANRSRTTEILRVTVPVGDPANAIIFVIPHTSSWDSSHVGYGAASPPTIPPTGKRETTTQTRWINRVLFRR